MFKPGESGNPEGRKKGSQNHYTKQTKEAFGMLLEGNLENLSTWLEQVAEEDPKEALKIVMALSERFVPKLSQQALTDADGENLLKGITFGFGPTLDEPKDDSPV
tara:strand:+ start:291 stop:605 length:315 start_codon:yes stop_codon:yes gene_type:complete